MSSSYVQFAVMATFWGLTWIAIKIGVAAIPPFAFAAARLVAAGSILLLLAYRRGIRMSTEGVRGRIVAAAILLNTAAYGLLFWGMQFVPSGLSSVVNLSLIPVGLFVLGLAAREETFTTRKAGSIALGIAGLVILFLPKLRFDGDGLALAGMGAIVLGTLSYCWGSIVSRPLLRRFPALALSGWLTLVGGVGLLIMAAVFEPIGTETLRAFMTLPVLSSWMFLALAGSVIAFTIYLRLLRDWGPARAGLYAFVSPVIAVAVGVVVLDEPFGAYEIAGSTLMLAAAWLAMKRGSAQPRSFSNRA